jgi:hypothetical protein
MALKRPPACRWKESRFKLLEDGVGSATTYQSMSPFHNRSHSQDSAATGESIPFRSVRCLGRRAN